MSIKDAARVVGGQATLARLVGVTPQAVGLWIGEGVPAERVLPIVRATRGAVRPYDLRPDIYPDPDWMPPALSREDEEAAA